jgi:GT2 family glycosyltransferase
MKVMIGINTLTSIDQMAYVNHIQFFYRLGRNHPNIEFGLCSPRRMSIDRMRNITAKEAVDNNFDYVMFVDDDVLVPLDAFDKLLKCNSDIAAGWTLIRGYPFNNMFFKFVEGCKDKLDYYKDEIIPGSIISCDAVGFSCVLIKTSLLKNIPPPWFVSGTHNTEDIYFCLKAKDLDPNCTILVNTSVITGHILGSEIISPLNKQSYIKYVEESDSIITSEKNSCKDHIDSSDRGDYYLNMIKESL